MSKQCGFSSPEAACECGRSCVKRGRPGLKRRAGVTPPPTLRHRVITHYERFLTPLCEERVVLVFKRKALCFGDIQTACSGCRRMQSLRSLH